MTIEASKREVLVPSQHLLRDLLGTSDSHFREFQESFPEVRMVARGASISLKGPSDEVELAESAIKELLLLVQEGTSLAGHVGPIVQMVRDELPDPAGVLSQTLSVGRGRLVRVKTHRQLLYVQAIRENTATFAVGPAGTGKTYLAMAAAVEALVQGSCRRIVLTRPAVEAGERPAAVLTAVIPEIPIAFEVEPLGMMFALVASFLWIVTTIYSIGYMRGHGESHSTESTRKSSTRATRTSGTSATRAAPWKTRPTRPGPTCSCGRAIPRTRPTGPSSSSWASRPASRSRSTGAQCRSLRSSPS